MLKARSIPTRLIDPDSRPAVAISAERSIGRFPTVTIGLRLMRWGVASLSVAMTGRGSAAGYGRRLRMLLEDLGGLWIKLGQLLALRVDLFPLEFCQELSALQVKAVGFSPRDAREIVQADLGGSVDEIFAEFDEVPIAAASMGQVHLAHLPGSGVRVAVKVQRPHLPEVFRHQMRVIAGLVRLLQIVRFRPHMRWGELIWELGQIMEEEMDCRYEASFIRRMRRNLKAHGIYAPKVFHATKRVLVTEFIDGVLMSDYIHMLGLDPERVRVWCEENNVDPSGVGQRLVTSMMRQLIEDNLYHGDVHPGNVMLLRHGGIALIDFGACNFTEREYLEQLRRFFYALATRDYTKAADLSIILSGPMARVDVDTIRLNFIGALRRWGTRTGIRELPHHEKSITSLWNTLVRILYEHRCTMEWGLLRIRRAQETLDASIMHLFPDVDYNEISAGYFRGADRRVLMRFQPRAPETALGSVRDTLEIQERLDEYTLFQAAVSRRHAYRIQSATNKAVDLLARVVSGLMLVAAAVVLLATALATAQRYPYWVPSIAAATIQRGSRLVPISDWQIWSLILGVSVYTFIELFRLRGRLRQHDPRPSERVTPV